MDTDIPDIVLAVSIVKRQQQRCIGAAIYRQCDKPIQGNNTSVDNQITYRLELIDFVDNEHFSSLDTLLVQVGRCRLYLPEEFKETSKGDGKKIHNIFQRKDIEAIYMKKSMMSKRPDTCMKIEKLCGRVSHACNAAEKERPLAFGSVECIIQGLNLMDLDSLYGKYIVVLGSLDTFMRLDSAAAEAVNLLPKPDHPSVFGSIYGVLNRCKTKMGARLLERWLRQPLINANEINRRLDVVELLKSSITIRNKFTDEILKSIPDLDTAVTKMQRKNAYLSEVYRLYVFSKSLPKIIDSLSTLVNDSAISNQMSETMLQSFLVPFQSIQEKFSMYEQLVEHTIDFNELPDLIINAKHDPELAELKEEQDEIMNESQELLRQARTGWCSGVDVKLEENNIRGLVFRSARADDERQIRANNSSVRIITIQKNGVHFTIPQLEELSDRLSQIQSIYKSKQSSIAVKVIETALSYLSVAELASSLVAELDVLNSFANVAATSANNYTRPKILPMGSGMTHLKNARHPCVELMDNVSFIANDYDFVRSESNYQIITGPNMGGKSTYIRGIGSIMVMAQVGSYIPCDDGAVVSVVDSILARVGAGDAVQKGVSTFMAEMLEASVILQTATSNSLLIIDELGRGTSTFAGFGIAWAMSEFIVKNINCMTLFATHFHELTVLQKHHSGVINKHVSAVMENNQLVMMYSLQPGPCSESFGVCVASAAGFPKSVISEARRKAADLERVEGDIDDGQEEKRQRVMTTMTEFGAYPIDTVSSKDIQPTLKKMFPPYPIVV